MEPDHRTGWKAGARRPVAYWPSQEDGGAQPQLGYSRSHMICSGITLGENRAGSGRGWLW